MNEETVEFESVTVKIPRKAMDYLRRRYSDPIKWLGYHILDGVRADIDAIEPEQVTNLFELDSVFKTVLDC